MPFASIEQSPQEVQNLPKPAQAIWLSIFNSAFRTFSGSEDEKEEAAFIAAWSAVNSKFSMDDAGKWMAKSALSFQKSLCSSRFLRVMKFHENMMEASKRITYGEVYVPWDVDSQGHFADESVIEEAAHDYLKNFRVVGEQHEDFDGKGIPVESFLSRAGDSTFPTPGSWVLGTQWSEAMWEKILRGEKTGYSLGGELQIVPIVAGAELAKPGSITKKAAKSAARQMVIAELDDDVFEKPSHTGPRILSQIIKMKVGEVSGVDLGANRRPFRAFKSEGGPMSTPVAIAGQKEEPALAWKKLYQQFIDNGLTPADARAKTEEALGPEPKNPFSAPPPKAKAALSFEDAVKGVSPIVGEQNAVAIASMLQAKFPAGPHGGIALGDGMTLEQAVAACVESAKSIGVKLADPEGPAQTNKFLKGMSEMLVSISKHLKIHKSETIEGEDAMTPTERQEFDSLKSEVSGVKSILERIEKSIGTATPAAKAEAAAPPSPTIVPGAPVAPAPAAGGTATGEEDDTIRDFAGVDRGMKEVANFLESMEAKFEQRFAALEGRPGTSAVEAATAAAAGAGAVTLAAQKSVGGPAFSTIISCELPAGARERQIEMAARKAEKRAKRFAANGIVRVGGK